MDPSKESLAAALREIASSVGAEFFQQRSELVCKSSVADFGVSYSLFGHIRYSAYVTEGFVWSFGKFKRLGRSRKTLARDWHNGGRYSFNVT